MNRIGATVALLTIGFLAIPYLAIYLLDRRRREYGAMLIYGLTLAHTPLTLLGAYSAFGPIGRHLWLTLGVSNLAALLLSVHSVFELEPVRRGWWIAIGGYAGLAIASPAFPALLGVVILLHGPLTIAVNGYTLVRFVLLARRGPFAFEARLILAGSLFSAAIMAQGVMWVRTGDSPLGGLHPMPIGIAVSMLLQAIVLAHQHVRRQRAVETANIDLQRQVAERSRELGDALRALGTSPPAAQPAESSSIGELRARFGDVVWARRAIAQLATQIAAIHAAGGVHRGVTLAALQIDGDEIRLAGADESHTIAARGGAVATAADDILALGRIAHELLTGVPAGSGELATLPSALAAIIARCLNADPARRPTADEIVSACSDGRRAS